MTPEETKKYRKAYHATHREKSNAQSRAYRLAHREEILAQRSAYNAAHRKERVAYNVARKRARREQAAGRPKPKACEVCGRSASGRGLHFDHDHQTGRFRGWLCGQCNHSLGLLNDSPALLRALADYIEGGQVGVRA